ncbi:MAG TPA: murein biosynthesis integral membrane protein MurJ [Candidatus Acidoferrum sp.]|nr:murein biosynthesis integral membrane protein MurJ [Candidatus Acidoferrum sp.]
MSAPPRAEEHQVVRALGSIGAATLASRVLGFVRDMVIALTFGAGGVTDAFVVAFRIPNMLRRLLGEGALSTAVIPVFTDYALNRSRDEFVRMIRAVLAAGLLVIGLTIVCGIVGAPLILRAIAPGFGGDSPQASLTILLTRVMFPYLLLVGLGALAMGALNTHGRFFASALGPALLNVGIIAAVLLLARRVEPPILALAIGVLVGGVAQLLAQVPSLRRLGLLVGPSLDLGHPALGRVARLLLPAVFGLAAVQVTVFVNTLLASLLPPGSISFLYYADRIMEFPLGIFGIALASASLPAMSRAAARGDRRAIGTTLTFALGLSFYVAVPATVGLVLLRAPIVRVLFERGEFTAADTAATAQTLVGYAVGLVAFSGARIVAQAFYAVQTPGVAVKLGLFSVAANVVAAVSLMGPLGHTGLALASSISAWVNFATLAWVARTRFGGLDPRELATSLARTTIASAVLGAFCIGCLRLWPLAPSRLIEAACLAAAIAGGAVVFWLTSALLGAPERRALSRLHRSSPTAML